MTGDEWYEEAFPWKAVEMLLGPSWAPLDRSERSELGSLIQAAPKVARLLEAGTITVLAAAFLKDKP